MAAWGMDALLATANIVKKKTAQTISTRTQNSLSLQGVACDQKIFKAACMQVRLALVAMEQFCTDPMSGSQYCINTETPPTSPQIISSQTVFALSQGFMDINWKLPLLCSKRIVCNVSLEHNGVAYPRARHLGGGTPVQPILYNTIQYNTIQYDLRAL